MFHHGQAEGDEIMKDEGFGGRGYLFTPREKGNIILNHSSAGLSLKHQRGGLRDQEQD